MDNKERNQVILDVACGLMAELQVEVENAFVEDMENEEKEDQVLVSLTVGRPGSLIGFRGKNLAALQLILALMVKKKLQVWVRVLLDVNNYRQEQRGRLEKMAVATAEKVLEEKKAIALTPMSAFERRLCHMALANMSGISSDSEGEGEDRHIVIKPLE